MHFTGCFLMFIVAIALILRYVNNLLNITEQWWWAKAERSTLGRHESYPRRVDRTETRANFIIRHSGNVRMATSASLQLIILHSGFNAVLFVYCLFFVLYLSSAIHGGCCVGNGEIMIDAISKICYIHMYNVL